MTDTPTADEAVVRPYADFLVELRRGAPHAELSTALHDLFAAVRDTGKPGSITFTIKASVQKRTDMIAIADSITRKLPALERPESLWFVDNDGNPTRRDPNQLEFEGIRAVPTTPTIGESRQA
ncbi:hypothetical protein [Nocardia niigatensis]